MIAQILAARRPGGPIQAGPAGGGESWALKSGVHCARAAVAIALIPALIVFVTVGIVGAGVTSLIGRATRPGR